jgi:hypothetical protein
MHRLRNAALVTALLVTGPTLAGTPIVSSGGTETPSTDLASTPVMGEAAPLVADFRWGALRMGAVPYLPVPPPYRMRAEGAGALTPSN